MPQENKLDLGVPAIRDKNYALTYANTHRIRITTSDCAITFGVIHDEPQDGAVVQKAIETATVILQYQHLKILTLELQSLLSRYEQIAGPIFVEPSAIAHTQAIQQVVQNVIGPAAAARTANAPG